MTEIARVSDYEGLVRVIDMRRKELGFTHLDVDEVAGLQTGYFGKIVCGAKRMGAMSLTSILGALKVEMVLVRAAGGHRNKPASSCAWTLRRKKLAEKGQRAFKRATTREKRRANARKAARARWRKVRSD